LLDKMGGKKVTCQDCQTVFLAPPAQAFALPSRARQDDEDREEGGRDDGHRGRERRDDRAMRYDARKKEVVVAYLLWLFLGFWGAHRFYLGFASIGLFFVTASIIAGVATCMGTPWGLVLLAFASIQWIYDGFLIPRWASEHNEELIDRLMPNARRKPDRSPPSMLHWAWWVFIAGLGCSVLAVVGLVALGTYHLMTD
jgi:TM2 domain-containing membrane protein YozV